MKIDLKNDWTWAYFIYNISLISYWATIFIGVTRVLLPIFTNHYINETYILTVPVSLEYNNSQEKFDQDYDFARIHLGSELRGNLTIRTNETTNTSFLVYLYSIRTIQFLIWGFLFFQLKNFLKNIAEKKHFNSKNPDYLFKIGWFLIGSGIAKAAVFFLPIPFEEKLHLPQGFDINAFLLYGDNLIIIGLFSIVLGQVFKEATRIYEEQKLTV